MYLNVYEIVCVFFSGVMHGFGCWFDVNFNGSTAQVVLSTSPYSAGTHWYQCRLLLREPVAVNATQKISGSIAFKTNEKLSYTLTVTGAVGGGSGAASLL